MVKKSIKAIDEAVPSTTKMELQSLLSKINFIRRIISNLSEGVLPFSPLLKLKMIKNLSGVIYNKRRLWGVQPWIPTVDHMGCAARGGLVHKTKACGARRCSVCPARRRGRYPEDVTRSARIYLAPRFL